MPLANKTKGLQLSWLERYTDNVEVRGSSPRRPTKWTKWEVKL